MDLETGESDADALLEPAGVLWAFCAIVQVPLSESQNKNMQNCLAAAACIFSVLNLKFHMSISYHLEQGVDWGASGVGQS